MKPALIDFECRSAISLRAHGAWRYSCDPTTEVLCLGFRLPTWTASRTALWQPEWIGTLTSLAPWKWNDVEELWRWKDFEELLMWIREGRPVEAHNAWFELCIWQNIMVPRYSWPPIAVEQWRCSMAKASAHALPRGLKDAGAALGLDTMKDATARPLLLKMAKPRKPLKKELGTWESAGKPLLWHEKPEQFERLFAYCRQDVLAEQALSDALPDLSPPEQRVFTRDLQINLRGFQLDDAAVQAACTRLENGAATFNAEIARLTDGHVTAASQRARLLSWLIGQGVDIADTQAETISETLESPQALSPDQRRILRILQELGRSSTAKYRAMQDWEDPRDHRVRGALLYHGASTGRWTGRGVQPHNFPKGHIGEHIEEAWTRIKDLSQDVPLGFLAEALRGTIVAPSGKVLYVADYSAIEARVLHWLAGDEETLEVFRTGADLYCAFASNVFGFSVTKAHVKERQLGKIAILGLGYGMGAAKFQATCEQFGGTVDEELAQTVVTTYREKFGHVKALWAGIQTAAVVAVTDGAATFQRIRWFMEDRFLYAALPSGRRLAYADPQLQLVTTPWGSTQSQLTYNGVLPLSHHWGRQRTYGGMLVENVVSAIARDIMAEAMVRCEVSGRYDVVLSVHDEIVAEGGPARTSVAEFESLVTHVPSWAEGCPITAEAWSGQRYRK